MHPFTGITKKLQRRSIDVVKAFNEVESVVNDIGAVRSNIDSEFDSLRSSYEDGRENECYPFNSTYGSKTNASGYY